MINIKDLLFKLLDEMNPNELLELRMNSSSFGTVFIANKKSLFPLAIDMDVIRESTISQLEMEYRDAYSYENAYEDNFITNHSIILNGKRYLIIAELLDVQFQKDYFMITVASANETATYYYKYENIALIKKVHESDRSEVIKEYNNLNYKYKSNNK